MRLPHLFEFMDVAWLPSGLRATMRDILECGNSKPFRPYYDWVADEVLRVTADGRYQRIVELGAGTAPITRHLARDPRSDGLSLIVCDGNPDEPAYRELQSRYPDKVDPRYEPVDFSQPHSWGPGTLLVLSGTFHHIPARQRPQVLETLDQSADRVMIFEPLRKTLSSILFVFLSLFPALLVPLWYLGRPGRLRRVLWCWLVPMVPLMFWWDGIASCLRMWTREQWDGNLRQVFSCRHEITISRSRLFSQCVSWQSVANRESVSSAIGDSLTADSNKSGCDQTEKSGNLA